MTAFSIQFLDVPSEYPYDDPTTEAARGLIVLGDFKEEFLASLHEWTRADYRQQWKASIQSFLEGGEKAVLITEYGSPARLASHLVAWVLYRKEENVLAQNQLLYFGDFKCEFNATRVAELVKEHRSHNDEGTQISEWVVSLNDLQDFAREHFARKPGAGNVR